MISRLCCRLCRRHWLARMMFLFVWTIGLGPLSHCMAEATITRHIYSSQTPQQDYMLNTNLYDVEFEDVTLSRVIQQFNSLPGVVCITNGVELPDGTLYYYDRGNTWTMMLGRILASRVLRLGESGAHGVYRVVPLEDNATHLEKIIVHSPKDPVVYVLLVIIAAATVRIALSRAPKGSAPK